MHASRKKNSANGVQISALEGIRLKWDEIAKWGVADCRLRADIVCTSAHTMS